MQAVIIGAGSAIGRAVARRWLRREELTRCWMISRSAAPLSGAENRHSDHGDGSRKALCREIEAAAEEAGPVSRVLIALGTLHGAGYGPEKSLRQLDGVAMAEVMRVNCVLPLLWLSSLSGLLRHSDDCRVAVISARVGSIGDNGLGGWYSYRSAKAALNMGLKSAAVELARQARGTKLVAYHPGTVDTPLSKPFQGRVAKDRLFTPDFAAERLDAVLDALPPDGELAYVDWAGKSIPW